MQEQVAKAAGSFIEVMKAQPLSLALVVMNLALMGYLYYEGMTAAKERGHEFELLYKNRREVSVLLARCNWPAGEPLPKGFDFDAK